MTSARYAEVVRRLVRRVRAEPTPRIPSDKRRLVAAVEEALRARAQRRRLLGRAVGLTFGAAAVLALVIGTRALRREAANERARASAEAARVLTVLGVDEARGGGGVLARDQKRLQRGMVLGSGIHLVAPASEEVRVGTAKGTLLTLEPLGDLTVTEASATQRFALRQGAVRAHVARLSAGERFVIDTKDAEVEVHGTMFRVAVVEGDPSCGDGAVTRVSVSEGVVSVRAHGREVRIFPGGAWPEGCAAAPVAAVATEAPRRGRERGVTRPIGGRPATEVAKTVPAARVPQVEAVAASALAAQNDLFSAALRAKKEGSRAEAAQLFGQLAARYPSSPLAEAAAVQRMKLLSADDARDGARAAADYLARFPTGFARAEAETLVARSAP